MNGIAITLLKTGFELGFKAARAYVALAAKRHPNMSIEVLLKGLTDAGNGVDEYVEEKLKEIIEKTNDDLKAGLH